MNKYWFKPKDYGYGYVPISVEGWVTTLGLILIGIFLAYINSFFNPLEMNIQKSIFFLLEIIFLGFLFLKLFEKKCKGKLKWNWGK
jgi:positive regulator of sigma E activity